MSLLDNVSLPTYLAVLATSAIAAAVNSMAGGGTFLTFPALNDLAGLSEKVANMTSSVGLWPGSASSVFAAREDFKKIPASMLKILGCVSFVGGVAGSLLLIFTKESTFRLVIPWLLAFATILFGFSKPIAKWAAEHGAHSGHSSKKWTFFIAALQLLIGVYGGYFGAGIGVLMLAGLSFAGLEDLRLVNSLKVLLNCIINAVTAVVFISAPFVFPPSVFPVADRIEWHYALGMAILATIGGFVGMQIARKIKPQKLRVIILSIGILLSCIYFYKAYFKAPRPPATAVLRT